MALSLRCSCYTILFLSSFSSFIFLHWSYFSVGCHAGMQIPVDEEKQELNLLAFPAAWNLLHFPNEAPPRFLKIALFVKKWPERHRAGGLERHALTLHHALAKRGHELHVFTSSSTNLSSIKNLYFHLSKPTAAGYLDQATVWKQFIVENSTGRHFDVIHTESVGLMHTRSRNLTNLAVSWHGIAYESIHSDIIQELLRDPEVTQTSILREKVSKVVEEIKFFPRYAHHVATSDHVGDILKRIYMLPEERVHIILNGVDEEIFKPEASKGTDFKWKFGIQESKSLILGMAGRLVKDKGHPLIFEALRQIFNESSTFRDSVIVLVAGDGPWGARYKDLGSTLHVLGPLEHAELAGFYNAIDVFVNPTLRAQGLDHTLLEAMLVGKPLVATKLASITGSVIVSKDIGYTFSPTVEALKKALYEVWEDGRVVLEQKGRSARKRALQLFTATKMAAAYERLFLCITEKREDSNRYCTYKT
ncbi:UNVERIFIED_CONTAM: putative glycosyltransferase EpsF [Sesamum angustifolium]|uniref:Glycosyltransferase EpsF n=1 Tax=Sesamum angustifolium TaxID=2727405 RepID=A0AAW2QQH2_9LAMI